ncbi:pentapeptide repeat-containing protein [Nonomuraea lactucae]|uniref:pentapeptide repeat-containing protein n=1 Tax=Nonomuraea lactucae TaxID=2249762 RepID=UPI000DE4A425
MPIWPGQHLSRFCFADSNLDGAILAGCDLSETSFAGASLRKRRPDRRGAHGADFAHPAAAHPGEARRLPRSSGPTPPLADSRRLPAGLRYTRTSHAGTVGQRAIS